MPTYDYECAHCGHKFEAFQKITDKPFEECPKCGKKIKRLIGAGSGIIFKGSGFYTTDYRKGAPPKEDNSCPKSKEGCRGCKPPSGPS